MLHERREVFVEKNWEHQKEKMASARCMCVMLDHRTLRSCSRMPISNFLVLDAEAKVLDAAMIAERRNAVWASLIGFSCLKIRKWTEEGKRIFAGHFQS
jgi:hypothetical protein